MTKEEIQKGKILFMRVNSIYGMHPELRDLNNVPDRYEQFVEEMSEKYHEDKKSIKLKIHRG